MTVHHSVGMDASLLFMRIVCGYAFILHGWGKIQQPFAWMGADSAVPGIFQALAALSEVGGGLAWIIGLLVPLASLGIACTMVVAVYFHAVINGDPFVRMGGGGSYELALIFLTVSLVLLTAGPGRFALDRYIFGRK